MHFLIEAKSLLSSPGKMIGEQYKITGIAQAETIRHTRDLWKFVVLPDENGATSLGQSFSLHSYYNRQCILKLISSARIFYHYGCRVLLKHPYV